MQGAARSADRGTEWALDNLVERDGLVRVRRDGASDNGRDGAAGRRADVPGGGHGRHPLRPADGAGSGASCSPRRSRRAPSSRATPKRTARRWPASTRSTTRARPTGPWPVCTRAFPGQGWGEAADRIGGYLAKSRDDVEDYWPAIPDHWAAYGASETVEFPERGDPPLTEDELDYARRQAGLFGVGVRWVAQQAGPWGELVRGGDTPRGGGYGVMSEALTGWWLAALADPRLSGLREPVADRAMCVAGHAVEAQSDAEDAAGAARPGRVEGAWFHHGETRMDDQQHALAGLLRTIPIAQASAGGASDPGDDAPSGWLWAIVLVLALNPARAAFAVPRANRTRRDVLGVCVDGRGDRRPRGRRGRRARRPAARRTRRQRTLVPCRRGDRRRARRRSATCSGDRLSRSPRCPAAARRSSRSRFQPWPARPCSSSPSAPAPTRASSSASARWRRVSRCWPGWSRACLRRDPSGRVLLWASRLLAAALVAGGAILTVDGIMDV